MNLATYVAGLPLLVLGIGGFIFGVGRLFRAASKRSRDRRALVLNAVRAQQPNGTGYTLTKECEQRLGKRWPIASIYGHLFDLEREGVIASRWGEATAARGGYRPRHYWVKADLPDLAPPPFPAIR
ncbi:PadR family transcriptional regulator [Methylorubrum populi]|uniref:PadR family transcriptional regulator n=1 Tax=Methylorubrum populi TaxID=223967 RepID=A0A169RFW6_9HYPH|nr:PadR family transcriptional regulator [Methylorubrum populi]BAU93328.1 PadR family transcriptional regulator [Methylorubrum populi]